MKLIFAIVNNDDSASVAASLTSEGFSATKLATTGGFLKAGNTTFIIGTQDDKVDEVLKIVEEHSRKRSKVMTSDKVGAPGGFPTMPVEVKVGGATVFIVNVESFWKC